MGYKGRWEAIKQTKKNRGIKPISFYQNTGKFFKLFLQMEKKA